MEKKFLEGGGVEQARSLPAIEKRKNLTFRSARTGGGTTKGRGRVVRKKKCGRRNEGWKLDCSKPRPARTEDER